MSLHWLCTPPSATRRIVDTIGTPHSESGPKFLLSKALGRKFPGGRGTIFAALFALLFSLPFHAQTPTPDPVLDPALAIETIPLYSGPVPKAKGSAPTDIPTLTVFRPKRPNGTAVIVDPGGAYLHLATSYEGRMEADRLSELGVTAFVLKYRLGPTYLYPVPLDDARRAVRLVRSLAPQFHLNPDRIGMMGFSAGGHLAATTGTLPEPGHPNNPDPVEHESSKLDFMILIYPWLNAMQPQVPSYQDPNKLLINYCSVTKGLTQADCTRLNQQYTPVDHVTAQTPPAFIAHTADDNTVPVAASMDFFNAMHKVHADAELHIFSHGSHGFGTGSDSPELYIWQDLLANWMRAHDLLTPATPATAR